MTRFLAPRLPTFSNGYLIKEDLDSMRFVGLTYTSSEGKWIFERNSTHAESRGWDTENGRVGNAKVAELINTGGFRGLGEAELVIKVRDPYLKNPYLVVVPREFRYRVIYHDRNTGRKLSKQEKMYGCHIDIFPITDDMPMRTCDIWGGSTD